MKQFIYANAIAAGEPDNISAVVANAIGFYHLSDTSKYVNTVSEDFAIVEGTTKGARVFPEVNFNTLKVTKSKPVAGTARKMIVTLTNVTAGKEYIITLCKAGVHFNERNTWTYSFYAKNNTAATMIEYFKNAFAANAGETHVNVTSTSTTLVFEAELGHNFELTFSGAFTTAPSVSDTPIVLPVNTPKQIQELYIACLAGKGMKYFGEDGKELYPNYDTTLALLTENCVVYTLRFSVGRAAAKTRDEVVNQVIHIAVPVNSQTSAEGGIIAKLDTMFGIQAKASE